MYPVKLTNNKLGRSKIYQLIDRNDDKINMKENHALVINDTFIGHHWLVECAFTNIDNYDIILFSIVEDSPFNLLDHLPQASESTDIILFLWLGEYTVTVNNKLFYKVSNLSQGEGLGIKGSDKIICESHTTSTGFLSPIQGIAVIGNSLLDYPEFEKMSGWSAYYSFKKEQSNYERFYNDFEFIDRNVVLLNKNADTTIVLWDEYNFWVYPMMFNKFISNQVEFWKKQNVNILAYLPATDTKTSGLFGIPSVTHNLFETAEYFIENINKKLQSTKKILFTGNCIGSYAPVILSHLTGHNSLSFNFISYPLNTFSMRYVDHIEDGTENLISFFAKHHNNDVINTCILNFNQGDEEFRQFNKFMRTQSMTGPSAAAYMLSTFEFYSNPKYITMTTDSFPSFTQGLLLLTVENILNRNY